MDMSLRSQLQFGCCDGHAAAFAPAFAVLRMVALSLLRMIDVRGAFDVLACVHLVQYDLGVHSQYGLALCIW